METRVLLPLLAALALPATDAGAQARRPAADSLPAFRSEAELSAFLRGLSDEAARRREAQAAAQQQAAAQAQAVARAQAVAQAQATLPAACRGAQAPRADGAQAPAVVHGRVTDATTGEPVAGAVLSVERLGICAVGGVDGRYRLVVPPSHLAPPRAVTVAASRIGYEAGMRVLTLAPGDSLHADFPLPSSVIALEGSVAAGSAVSTVSVTNTQHEGVDEGGIVKVHGDYLVMLRRGRLFTVSIAGGRLAPVSAVNAFGPDVEDDPADYYDELLVSGDQVVVIGYGYGRGTEVGVFRIDPAGRLHYRATYHLRSNDYYSSRNYASRLIGTKLVFYTPLRVPSDGEEPASWLPALRRWRPGAGDDDFRPIVSATRIHRPGRPLDPDDALALHTVTTCDLARPEMTCEGTAVLGPPGRVFYVSPAAVYVWVSDWKRGRGLVRSESMLYRLPLDGSGPRALAVAGSPVDQLSFLESGDGHLNVLVRSGAAGDAMWDAEHAGGDVSLLRVPLHRFGDGRRAAPRAAYRPLPAPAGGGYAFHNRFVGCHLLYGTGSGWWEPDRSGRSVLYAVPWAGGAVAEVPLPHGVDRIEGMGSQAVVVGTDGEDLHFTGVRLAGRPGVAQRYVSRGATQGELRTHGFFYRPDGADSGVLGLPIRGPGAPGYEHLFEESASVLFLRNRGARFHALGKLEARPDSSDDDGCETSCDDWYGNARPLFLRGRIFALLGYEIVEGTVDAGRLRETRRLTFAPRPATKPADR